MTEIFTQMETKFSQPVSVTKAKEAVPTAEVPVSSVVPAQDINAQKNDEFVSQEKETKKPKGPFGSFRSIISNIKKSLVSISEYTKGVFSGIKDGAIFGSIAFTGVSLKHAFDQHTIRKAAEKAGELVPPATKSKLAIPVALAVAAIAMVKNIWSASLDANKKKSDIHHKYIGHE